MNCLVPELDVADLDRSLAFYVGTIGFSVIYERPEEHFAYLDLQGAELMLEEADGPGRRLRTAPLEPPFGRGMNLQITVEDVDALHKRVLAIGLALIRPMEECWYRRREAEVGLRQFWLADPDGYVLRFCRNLGRRPLST